MYFVVEWKIGAAAVLHRLHIGLFCIKMCEKPKKKLFENKTTYIFPFFRNEVFMFDEIT